MENNDFAQRDLTYSLEAEQTVLGALLLEPNVITEVTKLIDAVYFFNDKHRKLYEIICDAFANSNVADLITVLNEAVVQGVFDSSAVGKTYLASIMRDVPSVNNVSSYCLILKEKYEKRELVSSLRELMEAASDGQETAETLLDLAEQKIYDIRKGKDVRDLVKIDRIIIEAIKGLEDLAKVDKNSNPTAKSGFGDLDEKISGLNKSDLLIIAARPAMGKTAFALNIATNVCRKDPDKKVVIFSLEMSKEQLAFRMMSSESRIESKKLKTGAISREEWERLLSGAGLLSRMEIYADDTAAMTVNQMKAKLRRVKGLGLVVIDYLQLMSTTMKTDNRVTIVSELTRQLKLMAKELDVPIIVLSQLARGPDSRTDHRPVLSDLRESGSIEQDADIVLFLYRDAYYNKDSDQQNLSECIVAKNRHGETGTVNLVWDGQFTRFSGANRMD